MVAQWIERLRPKEKVVGSTPTRVTIFCDKIGTFAFELHSLVQKTRFICSLTKLLDFLYKKSR